MRQTLLETTCSVKAEAKNKVTVIIRADRDAVYAHPQDHVGDQGGRFKKLQLRAEIGNNK